MALRSVSGKVAIVTGGASGIGLSFTKLLLSRKCSVVIGDLQSTSESEKLVKQTAQGNGPKILFKKTDVTNWDQLNGLFSFTKQSLGVADIVCPGAGIFEPTWSNFWSSAEKDSYKTLNINVTHPVRATRLAIDGFLAANKPGVVIHISSIGAQSTRLPAPMYCASKAFVSSFVRCMAELDEKQDIKVVAVAPGVTKTPAWTDDFVKHMGDKIAWITPEEIADAMLDLVEDPAYPGGTVLEAQGKGKLRKVETLNDPGPPGIGTGAVDRTMEDEIHAMLAASKGKDAKL